MKRVWLGRFGWLPATLLPLWALWGFSWFTLKGIEGWAEQAPRHYGVHLHKQQVQGQLELFARVIHLFETGTFRSQLEYLDAAYQRGEIDQMAVLFGLTAPVVILEKDGFEMLYPSLVSGPQAALLQDPETREPLVEMLKNMVERGAKEGIFSLPERRGPEPGGVGRHWYLSVAYSGEDLICVLLLPEDSLHRSADLLQAVYEERFREHLRRYLSISFPVLLLCSFCILLLAARGRPPGLVGEKGDEA